jgi:hypothetical protein
MIEILYFIRWSNHRMERDDPFARPMPLDEARALYDRRGLHTALVLREGQPYAAIESQNDAISVTFFDPEVRDYLRYWFRELAPGRLFLEQATYREYDGGSRDASTQTIYLFKPDGEIRINVDHLDKGLKDIGVPCQVDVSGNWEPYPAFGEYAGLLRTDRPMG